MRDMTENFENASLIVFVFVFFALQYIEWTTRKVRVTNLFGKTASVSIFAAGGTPDFYFRIASPMWVAMWVVHSLASVRPCQAIHQQWPVGWRIAFAAAYIAFLGGFIALAWVFRSRRRAVVPLTRGLLCESVKRLARKIAPASLFNPPAYVVLGPNCAKICGQIGLGVVLPIRLLNLMSRKEIDAVVARQLTSQSKQFYFSITWILLTCDVLAVAVAWLLHVGVIFSYLYYLALLAVQFLFLAQRVPQMLLESDLRLTGDAESFLSALGSLAKYGGAHVDRL